MDDGEIDLSNQDIFLRSPGDLPSTGSMDSFINEMLKDTHECTHIHTCNPPGPDNSHRYTCFHVHTKVVSKGGNSSNDDSAESVEKKTKRLPLGNREAVRKYRQKKKARTASLEDEVFRLKAVNQQLLKRLQVQTAMEAEVGRLKCLLVDIRGRIEGEIGSFPYQKSVKSAADAFQFVPDPGLPSGSYMMSPCNVVQCANEFYCQQNGESLSNAQDFQTLNCFASVGTVSNKLPSSGTCMGNLTPTVNSPGANERKAWSARGHCTPLMWLR